ncbi:hypothetical protein [Shewanella sp. AC91-MNA-CIBAN-0169]|uniref:hypothetical protein n=1 Tax=Shewanella sp. AC91-MNA-CIBAN-0169 TaxID=3140466 RepID=UPI00331756ED
MVTNFSSSKNLVMQIHVNSFVDGVMTVYGRTVNRLEVHIFIPSQGKSIICPLNYFQDSCSLAQAWILNDDNQKVPLEGISEVEKVIITKCISSLESEVIIPEIISSRLLAYFKDNLTLNEGFDCHAFACFLVDISCVPEAPNFNFNEDKPKIGDVVCLSTDDKLPSSIKHWAICLGDDTYISKFGKNSENKTTHVDIMGMANMHSLYRTCNVIVAEPLAGAEKWNGNFRR